MLAVTPQILIMSTVTFDATSGGYAKWASPSKWTSPSIGDSMKNAVQQNFRDCVPKLLRY